MALDFVTACLDLLETEKLMSDNWKFPRANLMDVNQKERGRASPEIPFFTLDRRGMEPGRGHAGTGSSAIQPG